MALNTILDKMNANNEAIQKSIQDKLEKGMSLTDADIEKYFPTPKEEPKVEPEMKPEQPKNEVEIDNNKGVDTDKVNTLLDILTKILNLILNFFKKK